MKAPFLGLYTAIYRVANPAEAKTWYSQLLGTGPYFDEPFYIGYNVGGYELGLLPLGPGEAKVDGVVAYWGVKDITSVCGTLEARGIVFHEPVTDVGGGIKTAAFHDPEGNLIGLIENPHFPNKA